MVKTAGTDDILIALREFGLAYPGAHTKSPWPGHRDLAVNNKTFAYLSLEGEPLRVSCKLPVSAEVALMLPHTTPTGYGLGKSGWVTATFADGHEPDLELLQAWVDESYRAQAPKRLIKQLAADHSVALVAEDDDRHRQGKGAARQSTKRSRSKSGQLRVTKKKPAHKKAVRNDQKKTRRKR